VLSIGLSGCGGSFGQSYTDGYKFAKTFAMPSGASVSQYCSASWQEFQNPNGNTGYSQTPAHDRRELRDRWRPGAMD
jgi:hypothetical protein